MKRNFWLAALVGVALTGCVNEESSPVEQQAQALSFVKPVYKTQSRLVPGEIYGEYTYSTNEQFKVYCRRYSGEFTSWLQSGSVDFFYGNSTQDQTQALTVKHDGTAWAPENNYYWPGDMYSLAFAAYSPADAEGTYSYGTNGLSITNFETESTSDQQYDLLYSERTVGCSNSNHGKVGKSVQIVFKHALSSIVFAASENVEGRQYKINSISITGKFVTKGSFVQNYNETTNTDDPTWTTIPNNDVEVNYTPTLPTGGVTVAGTSTEFTRGPGALLLLPQTVDLDAKLTLSYTVIPDAGVQTDYVVNVKLSDFKTTANNSIVEWHRNGRYVYLINFGGSQKISFTPSVTTWEENLQASYTIQ